MSLEAMVLAMMSFVAENGDIQRIGNEVLTRIETVQKTVAEITEKMQHIGTRV